MSRLSREQREAWAAQLRPRVKQRVLSASLRQVADDIAEVSYGTVNNLINEVDVPSERTLIAVDRWLRVNRGNGAARERAVTDYLVGDPVPAGDTTLERPSIIEAPMGLPELEAWIGSEPSRARKREALLGWRRMVEAMRGVVPDRYYELMDEIENGEPPALP
jgi:hypothetical protein